MIYEEPILRDLGDSYIGVEFGDSADLRNNFRVLALIDVCKEQNYSWAIDFVPTLREMGVVYDRTRVSANTVKEVMRELIPQVKNAEKVHSRLFKLPVWYDDPWSADLNRREGLPKSIDLVAEKNGMTVEEVIANHSSTEHWVTCVGWAPGTFFAYPITREFGVTTPKLKTARPYTPERTLTLGGLSTAALPFPGPSGYEMLGRLAVPIYDQKSTKEIFPEHGVLFRAGDRHKYVPVDPLEYEAVREAVRAGEYEYDMTEEWFEYSELERNGYVD